MRWQAGQAVRNIWIEEARATRRSVNANVALLRIDGPVTAARLAGAFEAVLAAHPALTSRFEEEAGLLYQMLPDAPTPPAMTVLDLTERDLRHALLFARRLADAPLAPRGEGLYRAAVLRVAPDLHLVLLCVSMLVSDGYSMQLLHRDFLAVLSGDALPARGAAGPILRASAMPAESADADLAYWCARLEEHPCRVPWPIARQRDVAAGEAGGWVERWSLKEAGPLDAFCAANDTTRFAVATAALASVLQRLTGWADVPLLLPLDGRRSANRGAVGHFLRVVPAYIALDTDMPFAEAVRASTAALLESQRRPDADLAQLPVLPSVMIAQNNAPLSPVTLGALRITPLRLHNRTAKFDLSVLVPAAGPVRLEATFRETLFPPDAAQGLLAQIGALLADPTASEPLLRRRAPTAAGLALVAGPEPAAPARTLPQSLIEAAARWPDRVALEAGDVQLTYPELVHAMTRAAGSLLAGGLRRGEPVLIAANRNASSYVDFLAVLSAGGIAVPVDPGSPPARIETLSAPLNARFALGTAQWGTGLQHPAPDGPVCPLPELSMRDPAYGIFTSGSTGRPKLVVNTHLALARLAESGSTLRLGPAMRIGQFASLAVDAALWDLAAGLSSGATLVMLPDPLRQDPQALQNSLESLQLDLVKLPPSLLAAFDRTGPFPPVCIVAGEVCPPGLVRDVAGRTRLFNAYGPTEAGCWTSFGALSPGPVLNIAAGRPLPGTAVSVRDPDGTVLPPGAWGEIWIAGDGLALGYFGDPDRTARDFVILAGSEIAGSRWYRSGDRGRLLFDGEIEIAGRYDRMVKIRGQRIYPEEIEAALSEVMPQGTRVHVAACPVRGNRLVAFVKEGAPEARTLHAHLAAHLPPSLAHPEIHAVLDWPVTAGGKTDVQALLSLIREAPCEADTVHAYRISYMPAGYLPLYAAGNVAWHFEGEAGRWAQAMAPALPSGWPDQVADLCVYLVGLDAVTEGATPEAFIARAHTLLTETARRAARPHRAPVEIWVLTNGLFDITADDPIFPASRLTLAWVKAAAVELTEIAVKLIDIGAGVEPDWSVALGALIGLPSGTIRACRGDRIHARRLLPVALLRPTLSPKARMAVFFGGGGISEALARELADRVDTVVFASRRAAPVSDLARNLPGVETVWLHCDVTKPGDLERVLRAICRRYGPPGLVGHFAAQSVGTSVLNTTVADLVAQYWLKAGALDTLAALTAEHAPSAALFCLSSYASFSGGFGSYAYAFGNLAAEAAAACSPRRIRVLAPAHWREVGMAAGLAQSARVSPGFAQSLQKGFGPAEGALALASGLADAQGLLYLSAYPLAEMEPNAAFIGEAKEAADILNAPAHRLRSSSIVPPASALEGWVAHRVSEVLGLSPIGREDDFFGLGGDSLQAADLAARLSADFDRAVGLATIYGAPRVCDLARDLLQQGGAAREIEALAAALLHVSEVPEGFLAGEKG